MGIRKSGVRRVRGWLTRFVAQLLAIMFLVEFVKGALLVSVLPLYLENVLRFSGVAVGLAFALLYVGDNAFRGPIGWVVDRIGYRAVMLAGVLFTLAAVMLLYACTNAVASVVACALLGIGTSPLWPCVVTGGTAAAGENARGTVINLIYLAWLAGIGVGPILINLVEDPAYRKPLVILIVMSAAALLLASTLPAGPGGREAPAGRLAGRDDDGRVTGGPLRKASGEAKRPASSRSEHVLRYLGEARRSLAVRPLFFPALSLQTFSLGLLMPVLTIYARVVLKLSAEQFSLLLLAGGSITVLLMLPVGRLCDRFGSMRFSALGFLVSGMTLLLFPATRSFSFVVAMVALLGIGYALLVPTWNALVASAVPQEKCGAVWGFFLTVEEAGTVTGSIVSGLLRDMAGPDAPFYASGVVLLVLLVAQMFIFHKRTVVLR